MRKSILYLAALSLVCLTYTSCGCSTGRSAIGAKIGVNLADVTGDEDESFDGKTDFHAGLVGNIGLENGWSFEPGLIYSRQGSDYSESVFSGEYNLDYLNVPVMAQYEVTPGLHLGAGPQLGILLSAKDKYSFDGDEMEEDIKDMVKSIDFGVNLGAGYMFDNGIKISANYNLGLTDLNDNTELESEGVKWKNSVIQFSLSYFIKLGDIKGESKD